MCFFMTIALPHSHNLIKVKFEMKVVKSMVNFGITVSYGTIPYESNGVFRQLHTCNMKSILILFIIYILLQDVLRVVSLLVEDK